MLGHSAYVNEFHEDPLSKVKVDVLDVLKPN